MFYGTPPQSFRSARISCTTQQSETKKIEQQKCKDSFMFSAFWDIIIIVSDHLQSTKGGFWVQVHNLYLRRCWRWIQKPDSQNDSSQIGASTPDSTFSWTAGEREKKRERENMSSITTVGKPGRNYGKCNPWKNTDTSSMFSMFLLLLTE